MKNTTHQKLRARGRGLSFLPSAFLSALLAFGHAPVYADETAAAHEPISGEEHAVLTIAPHVPPPITRRHASKVIVNLDVEEKRGRLSDGVEYTFWTFGGVVPGKFIRVREGDLVEFHLHNHPSSRFPHNIDLHAVTGPGGGAASSFTAPGHSSTFSFKALNPGLYVYHCATAPVGMHIANGMYGLILVEPKEGMPEADREYYVMQSEFYTEGRNGETGYQPFNMQKALDENPDYVVFNGAVGAMSGDNALPAKTGERVRLYVGNGGPNLVSSFHVIGEIFDKVWIEGGSLINRNVQSTLIPAGGSAIVEMVMQVPGSNVIVDHSIFRAFNKGALGVIEVAANTDAVPAAVAETVYSGKTSDDIYRPEGGAVLDLGEMAEPQVFADEGERLQAGESIYRQNCAACHQPDGSGVAGVFPPLAKSDWLERNGVKEAVRAIVNGLSGKIAVNGKEYNGVMPAMRLSDEEIAQVLSFVYSAWGNSGVSVSAEDARLERGTK
ncbi:MAG: copper-containing nitrite reductase [Gammaproteobacteria bacterium]